LRAGASDDEITGLIHAVWEARDDRYSEIRSEMRGADRRRVEMYEIGG
jgi:cyclic pyranopterin phosphate synthase